MVIVVAARGNGGWEGVSRGGRGLCYGCDGWTKREALHKTEMQTTAGQEAVIRLSAGAGEGTAVGYSSVQSRLDGGTEASMMIEPWKQNHQSNCLFAPRKMLVLLACDNNSSHV